MLLELRRIQAEAGIPPPAKQAALHTLIEDNVMVNIFNTTFEIEESGVTTAVLPMGSVEPKGPHLPVGLDIILANKFGHDFCTGKALYLMPVFPFSTAVEALGFPGIVALKQQTLWDVLFDIASVLKRHYFKNLIILDFSNHNWILKQCVREINLNRGGINTIWVNPKEFAREVAGEKLLPDYGGGAVETSLALAVDENSVSSLPEDFIPTAPREYMDYRGFKRISPEGYWGKPQKASIKFGKELYKLMLARTEEYIEYALALFPDAELPSESKAEELWWPSGKIPGSGYIDWHSSLPQIQKITERVAVIPTSSTEQHSTSQPVSTDYLQVIELSARAAEELSAYLLPALPVCTSWSHIHFKGTVTVSAMTARRIIEDIVFSLRAGGFKRGVIVNVHGGNWVLKPTLIELNALYRDFKLISTEDILSYRGQAPMEEIHACGQEASFIKAFYPACFKEDRVVDFSPKCTTSALDLVGMKGVSPEGVWGYPSSATAEKGKADLKQRVSQAVSYIRDYFDWEKSRNED